MANENFVFDTSALLTLHKDEPGATTVHELLSKAGKERRGWICFISLMEFFYILQQESDLEAAHRSYAALKQLPFMILESDEQLGLLAASLKATNQLSMADAWIAATAEQLDATLVHKDPEFEALAKRIKLQALPYKTVKPQDSTKIL